MLNRTNRTLSATNNRLNLGTRSLANVAGPNIGQDSLQLRFTHPQGRIIPMRDGKAMMSKRKQPTILGSYSLSSSLPPCSPSVPSWHLPFETSTTRFEVGLVRGRVVVREERGRDRAARPDAQAQSQSQELRDWAGNPTTTPSALVAITAMGG